MSATNDHLSPVKPKTPTTTAATQQVLSTGTFRRPDVYTLAHDALDKTKAFLDGELEGCLDEYKLLEDMNNTVGQRYTDMKKVAHLVKGSLEELNSKYSNLQPYIDQIDEIDRSSRCLEEAAYSLDMYVKNLESKFKQLEKK